MIEKQGEELKEEGARWGIFVALPEGDALVKETVIARRAWRGYIQDWAETAKERFTPAPNAGRINGNESAS